LKIFIDYSELLFGPPCGPT